MDFKGLKSTIVLFNNIRKEFGLLHAIKYIFYFRMWYGHRKYSHGFIREILTILEEDMNEFVESYNYNDQNELKETRIIWICWWQGIDSMPPICKFFYNNLKENVGDEWRINLITDENYMEYVDFPSYIIEKFKSGKIKIQQFSDILRQALLYQNGGMWMDITLYTLPGFTKTVCDNLPFWSANLGKVIKNNQIGQILTGCKWSGFLQYGKKGNLVNKFLYEGMCYYYKKHDITIDYFIQNYLFKLGYEKKQEIRKALDSIPVNNTHLYDLSLCINNPFENEKWQQMTKDTCIFKLTYKVEYEEYVDNVPTFYHYILNQKQ